ncbi:MAG: hypothetical protein WBF48_05675 [Halarcobacter sp.]
MQQTIINLKQRIEDNYQELHDEYGDSCQLVNPTLDMIDLLLSVDASDDKIKSYLQNVKSSIQIIEEKLERVERNK